MIADETWPISKRKGHFSRLTLNQNVSNSSRIPNKIKCTCPECTSVNGRNGHQNWRPPHIHSHQPNDKKKKKYNDL